LKKSYRFRDGKSVCQYSLRSLYFLLAGADGKFHYLQASLAVVLTFVGVKMLIAHFYKVPIVLSLGIVIGVLAIGVAASLVRARRIRARQVKHPGPDLD
jgi:predicted tellurium resistance membrane protein TerC